MYDPLRTAACYLSADYADTINHLDNFAESLELEAQLGNPDDTERLSKSAKLLRRAINLLQPLAHAEEITAADPATTEED